MGPHPPDMFPGMDLVLLTNMLTGGVQLGCPDPSLTLPDSRDSTSVLVGISACVAFL